VEPVFVVDEGLNEAKIRKERELQEHLQEFVEQRFEEIAEVLERRHEQLLEKILRMEEAIDGTGKRRKPAASE